MTSRVLEGEYTVSGSYHLRNRSVRLVGGSSMIWYVKLFLWYHPFTFLHHQPRLFAGLFPWFRSPRECPKTSNDGVREDGASGRGLLNCGIIYGYQLFQRIESRLENLQPGSNWQIMCATTPAEIYGRRYGSPAACFYDVSPVHNFRKIKLNPILRSNEESLVYGILKILLVVDLQTKSMCISSAFILLLSSSWAK